MEKLPVIMHGSRVVLTPARRENVPTYLRWVTDPELNVFLANFGAVLTLEQEYTWYDSLTAGGRGTGGRLVQLDIHLADEEQRLIGNCSLFDIDHLNGTAEVGILIGEKAYLGRGYGTEAMTLLCRYGFDALNLHAILLRYLSMNTRAARSYAKVGFREMGRFRQSVLRMGKRYDMVSMDLLPSELRTPAGEPA